MKYHAICRLLKPRSEKRSSARVMLSFEVDHPRIEPPGTATRPYKVEKKRKRYDQWKGPRIGLSRQDTASGAVMIKSDTGSPPCRLSRHRRRPRYTPQSPGHPQQQWKTWWPGIGNFAFHG